MVTLKRNAQNDLKKIIKTRQKKKYKNIHTNFNLIFSGVFFYRVFHNVLADKGNEVFEVAHDFFRAVLALHKNFAVDSVVAFYHLFFKQAVTNSE